MPLLFVGSGIFQYIGAAVAVGLFTLMSPLGVVWWRVALGAVVLALLWRPWRLEWTPRALALAAIFGVSLAVMNGLFYEAIARLPLGTVVAIEFLGPVVVAVIRGKGMLPRIAAALAFAGIILIGGWGTDLGAPQATAGFLFALGAAGSWARVEWGRVKQSGWKRIGEKRSAATYDDWAVTGHGGAVRCSRVFAVFIWRGAPR